MKSGKGSRHSHLISGSTYRADIAWVTRNTSVNRTLCIKLKKTMKEICCYQPCFCWCNFSCNTLYWCFIQVDMQIHHQWMWNNWDCGKVSHVNCSAAEIAQQLRLLCSWDCSAAEIAQQLRLLSSWDCSAAEIAQQLRLLSSWDCSAAKIAQQLRMLSS